MTDENWKIQVSPRVGDTLINLRAQTGEEMLAILGWYEQNSASIASALGAGAAGANVAGVFPGSQNVPAPQEQGWAQQGSQQSAPPAFAQPQQAAPQGGGYGGPPTKYDLSGPPGPAPQCGHGLMQWRHRTSQAGNEYKGWFCPSKVKEQQCETQWVRGK